MLIRDAEVAEGLLRDLRLCAGRIAEIDARLPRADGERVLDAQGGALLPGLHDHHLHLFALAAARRSLRCGPPGIRDREALRSALRGTGPGTGWIRGVAYHESVAGELDAAALDALRSDRPLRIQHRSGALWMLNSRGLEALGLARHSAPAGVERDGTGCPTGRLFGLDAWLRERLGETAEPSLAEVGRELAAHGVTGLTDAGPDNGDAEFAALARALQRGDLPQRLIVMGRADLAPQVAERIQRGPRKVLLRESELPAFDELCAWIEAAHRDGRAVAIHCVTRVELVFAQAAFAAAGCRRGDRIEHASLAPLDAIAEIASLPLTVVTQPHFLRERGDDYRRDVAPHEQPDLYRCRSWRERGVELAAGTDAPFGEADPWAVMRASVERCSAGGALLGADEALAPEAALALFTGPGERPGAAPRRIEAGAVADLCLLDRPWREARRELASRCVRATWCGGELVFGS